MQRIDSRTVELTEDEIVLRDCHEELLANGYTPAMAVLVLVGSRIPMSDEFIRYLAR